MDGQWHSTCSLKVGSRVLIGAAGDLILQYGCAVVGCLTNLQYLRVRLSVLLAFLQQFTELLVLALDLTELSQLLVIQHTLNHAVQHVVLTHQRVILAVFLFSE